MPRVEKLESHLLSVRPMLACVAPTALHRRIPNDEDPSTNQQWSILGTTQTQDGVSDGRIHFQESWSDLTCSSPCYSYPFSPCQAPPHPLVPLMEK